MIAYGQLAFGKSESEKNLVLNSNFFSSLDSYRKLTTFSKSDKAGIFPIKPSDNVKIFTDSMLYALDSQTNRFVQLNVGKLVRVCTVDQAEDETCPKKLCRVQAVGAGVDGLVSNFPFKVIAWNLINNVGELPQHIQEMLKDHVRLQVSSFGDLIKNYSFKPEESSAKQNMQHFLKWPFETQLEIYRGRYAMIGNYEIFTGSNHFKIRDDDFIFLLKDKKRIYLPKSRYCFKDRTCEQRVTAIVNFSSDQVPEL